MFNGCLYVCVFAQKIWIWMKGPFAKLLKEQLQTSFIKTMIDYF